MEKVGFYAELNAFAVYQFVGIRFKGAFTLRHGQIVLHYRVDEYRYDGDVFGKRKY